jgi:hypothetical protein
VAEIAELSRACHDINSSLAAIVICLQYLAEQTSGEMHGAVVDALSAARCIETVSAQLRERCRQVPPCAA